MLKQINLENKSFGVVNKIETNRLTAGCSTGLLSLSEVELVTYVINGKLTFKNSIGDCFELGRGEVMYSSCGENLEYSIANAGDKEAVFIQYYITPDTSDLTPCSEAHKYKWKRRINQWLEVVSKLEGEAQIRVNQDVKIEVLTLDPGELAGYAVDSDRMAYLIQLEGSSNVSGQALSAGAGLVIDGSDITLEATEHSHFIIIEMAKV